MTVRFKGTPPDQNPEYEVPSPAYVPLAPHLLVLGVDVEEAELLSALNAPGLRGVIGFQLRPEQVRLALAASAPILLLSESAPSPAILRTIASAGRRLSRVASDWRPEGQVVEKAMVAISRRVNECVASKLRSEKLTSELRVAYVSADLRYLVQYSAKTDTLSLDCPARSIIALAALAQDEIVLPRPASSTFDFAVPLGEVMPGWHAAVGTEDAAAATLVGLSLAARDPAWGEDTAPTIHPAPTSSIFRQPALRLWLQGARPTGIPTLGRVKLRWSARICAGFMLGSLVALLAPVASPVTVQGVIEASDAEQLASPVVGAVRHTAVVLGQHVHKGQALMSITSSDAPRDLQNVLATYREAVVETLLAQDPMVAASEDSAKARLALSREVQGARGTVLSAPMSGTVSAIHARPGELVQRGDPTLSIVATGSSMRIALSVPVHHAQSIRTGTLLELYEAGTRRGLGGARVTGISGEAMKAESSSGEISGLVRVMAELDPNRPPDRSLVPQEPVIAVFDADQAPLYRVLMGVNQ